MKQVESNNFTEIFYDDTEISHQNSVPDESIDIEYLKTILPGDTRADFFDYLSKADCKNVKIWAIPEGTVVFPRVPLIVVEGPLAICQLLETTLLNLVNYASLIATNAARCRLAAGASKELLEFGLRRAQGPNGGLSASKYAFVGGSSESYFVEGFDGTSNVIAGKLFAIPVRGTHAHSYVSSFQAKDLCIAKPLVNSSDERNVANLTDLAIDFRRILVEKDIFHSVILDEVNDGELAAFISYAQCFPNGFLALVDSYDVLRSGIVNFCACVLALDSLDYKAKGVRIDSGDLAYLSREIRRIFIAISEKFNIPYVSKLKILASNDLNEDTIYSLNEQGHEIDCFAVGTHLVTCQKQPALGCVYKLVELNNTARIKLSEDIDKVVLPGRKRCYRLYGKDGRIINDLLALENEISPVEGTPILCRHPFLDAKRAYVVPKSVKLLHQLYWNGESTEESSEFLIDKKQRVEDSLKELRSDIKRPLNPTPYKISVTESLHKFFHQLWQENAPIGRLE
uniref:Nicotinate phosphoribosyltransferase n=1 Tax=Romanomermis culicivorax TaxID=13658 RepID=A0A915KQG4_ROMCU